MDFAKSTMALFAGKVTGAAIQFLGIVYFARELGASAMGVFFLFQALIGLLSIPADFGLRGAIEKRISEGKSGTAILSSGIALKAVPLSVVVTGIVVFRSVINSYIGANVAIFLALGIILYELAFLFNEVLRGELRVEETAVLRVSQRFTWVVVGAILIRFGFGAKGLIYGFLLGFVIMALIGGYKITTSVASPTRHHSQSLLDYAKFNAVSSIGGIFYSWMDVAIIGLFLTQAHVGAYEVAWRVTAIVMLLSNSIGSVIFPQISRWNAEETRDRIETAICETITPSVGLVLPAFVGVTLLSREILGLIFGQEYVIAWLALTVLMADKIFQAVQVILGQSLQGVDKPDLAAYAAIATVFTNLSLNLILVFEFGLVGAAVATAISSFLNVTLHGYYLSKFVTILFPYKEIGWCVLSTLGMGIAIFLLQMVISVESMASLIGVISLAAGIYGVLVLTYLPLRVKIIEQIRNLLASI